MLQTRTKVKSQPLKVHRFAPWFQLRPNLHRANQALSVTKSSSFDAVDHVVKAPRSSYPSGCSEVVFVRLFPDDTCASGVIQVNAASTILTAEHHQYDRRDMG